jgi:hypothetical protein
MSFESPESGKSSFVVIGDTFDIQSRVNPGGAVCDVIMSNAYVLHTKFGHFSSNEVVQMQLWTDKYRFPFPADTKLVFQNSVLDLPKWKKEISSKTNFVTYEGDEALRQLKKMGMKPPPDMDIEKATRQKTQKSYP